MHTPVIPATAMVAAVFAAVAAPQHRPEAAQKTQPPSPAAMQLLTEIKNYASWPKFPEHTTPRFSKQHSNMYVVARYNPIVGNAMRSGTLPLPDGSIIVKENRKSASDPTPAVLTTMAKREGQWYWLETTMDGQVVVIAGKPLEGTDVKACRGCHAGAIDNDYVMTHKFK